jgi:hypothetical protein
VGTLFGVQRSGALFLPERREISEGPSAVLRGLQGRQGARRSKNAESYSSSSGIQLFSHMNGPAILERTVLWRRCGNVFLVVLVPIVHATGGFFILDFLVSGQYTWGRTLRTFVLVLSNLILAYEFVYRDLQTQHPDWRMDRLMRSVMAYSVIPFAVGMVALLALQAVTLLAR